MYIDLPSKGLSPREYLAVKQKVGFEALVNTKSRTYEDLENWETVRTLEDISERSVEFDGVQYPNFFVEIGNFYTVLRNALHGAHTFHDSNATVFKKYSVPNYK